MAQAIYQAFTHRDFTRTYMYSFATRRAGDEYRAGDLWVPRGEAGSNLSLDERCFGSVVSALYF